jgi:hypothetical protein
VNLHSAVNLGKIAVRDHLWRLVTDTDLETSWAPVNELDSALGFEGSNSRADVLRNDIATIQQTGGHVLPAARVTLNHLIVGLKARHGDLLHGVGLVGCFCSGYNWGVSNKREVNSRIWDQVGLKLVKINVEGAIKTQGGGDGRDNWGNLVRTTSD